MNVFESRTLFAWLTCLFALQTAQAQPPMAPGPEGFADPTASAPLVNDVPGQAVASNYFGYTEVDRAFEPLFRVDARGGNMYGQDGFTRISAFMPYWIEEDALVFADLGGFAAYNPGGGANLGVGWRWYNRDIDRLVGFNAWYDFDAGNQREYHQLSIGFESLGRYVDYRANGYVPISADSHNLNTGLTGQTSFQANNILLGRATGRESAFTGFDAEIGGPVPLLGRYGLSTYVGGYFFDSNNIGNVTGFSSRTQGQVNEDLTVGVQVTHDNVFDNNAQIQVTWTLPDGAPGRWLRQPRVRDRLTAPVVRNYRVVTRQDILYTADIALNPADGDPFFVAHINPNRTPGTGTGTFEDPYSQLNQFNNLPIPPKNIIDIISVTARDDGTSTQLNTGVTLLNNQRLLSTAVTHTFTAIQGTFDLPGFVGGPLPVLANLGGGNVVTFATNNRNIEVSGFTINGSVTGNGIAGVNNQRVNINRNVIQNGLNGVQLTNLNGVGPANRSLINDNDFLSNFGDGFSVINNAAPPLEIFITNNTAVSNLGNGLRLQSEAGSSIGGRITGNSTANVGSGTSNVNNGLALFADGGTLDFFNAVNGWQIGGTGTDDTNNFSDNGNFGVNVAATGGSNVSLRFLDNDISRNSLNGLGFAADSGNNVLAVGGNDPTIGNRFANNGLNGILLDLTGTSLMSLNIQNNTLTQNGNGGLGGGTGGVPVSLYNLDVVFGTGLTASQQAIFAIAAAKWQAIITGDVPDQGLIDDLEIAASGVAIDGVNGILGQAGPTSLRAGTFLPFEGIMEFDTADLAALEASGQLDDVILHEMAHVIGFGTIWTQLGLLTGGGTADPQFTGANAVAEYNARFGLTATSVPIEGAAGPGTNDAHWRETVFTNELMTGFLDAGVPNPISRMTVGQFQDLGYQVNYGAADPYIRANGVGIARPVGQASSTATPFAGPVAAMAPASLVSLVAVGPAVGDGINISVTGNAQLNPATILDNDITQSGRHGLFVATNGSGNVPNLQVRRNTIDDNGTGTIGSGIFLDRQGASTLNMTAEANIVTNNLGDGLTVNSQGAAAGVNINSFDNTFDDNAGNGANLQAADVATINLVSNRDTLNSNTLNGLNALSEDSSTITLALHNILSNGNTLNGINLASTDLSVMQVLVDSPADVLFTGIRSTVSGNTGNGINVRSNVRSQMDVNIVDTDVLTNFDGLSFTREDSSLMRVLVDNVTASRNRDEGLEFFYAGANNNDPLQPLTGTPNTLTVVDSRFNLNVGNGLRTEGRADAVLLTNITSSQFNTNGDDGLEINTFEAAAFGLSPANRSVFDAITVTGNINNGIELNTNSNFPLGSFMFLDINSNSGNTLISNNTNGIEINAAGNTTDIIIQGDGAAGTIGTTVISNNRADGVEINVFSSADIAIRDVTIDNNGGDGIDVNNFGNNATLTVGAAGDPTIISNNTGDGISFRQDGEFDDIATVITNTRILNNDGHGLSMVGNGPLDEDDTSSTYFATMTNSVVQGNGLNGVNLVLNGHMLGNQFVFDNNTLANNGRLGTDDFTSNGFFLQQNAQDTLKSNLNSTLFRDASIPAPSAFPVNPNNPALTGLPDYDAPYLNLTTALQSELVFTRNVVNFNGNNAIGSGEGLYLRLSTNSYLAADVGGATGSGLGNTFAGNTLADFRTGSFLATASGNGTGGAAGTVFQPPNGTDNADPAADIIFLDDTAQLDLRFKNNTGTDLNPSLAFADRARYTNSDPAKGVGNTNRLAQYFQVDGPPADIDNSNNFLLPGFPGATESDLFNFGQYNVRNFAAPVFPNPGFPPFQP